MSRWPNLGRTEPVRQKFQCFQVGLASIAEKRPAGTMRATSKPAPCSNSGSR
jgi:hypothetical protein